MINLNLRLKELEAQLERRDERIAELERDAGRLDWLEEQTKASRTGISFDYVRHVEDGYVTEKGYRFMRHHLLGERVLNIRQAIDAAMKESAT